MYGYFGPSGRQILAMLIAVCVLLCATHWAAYKLGQRSLTRSAVASVIGSNSPFLDVATIAIDKAADGVGAAWDRSVRESIQQCHAAVAQANGAMAACNNRLGVLIATHEAQRAAAAAAIDEQRKIYVRVEQALDGPCADWAAQPVCPALLSLPP